MANCFFFFIKQCPKHQQNVLFSLTVAWHSNLMKLIKIIRQAVNFYGVPGILGITLWIIYGTVSSIIKINYKAILKA